MCLIDSMKIMQYTHVMDVVSARYDSWWPRQAVTCHMKFTDTLDVILSMFEGEIDHYNQR